MIKVGKNVIITRGILNSYTGEVVAINESMGLVFLSLDKHTIVEVPYSFIILEGEQQQMEFEL